MNEGAKGLGVDDVIVTDDLGRRTSRPSDFGAESRALRELAEALAQDPDQVLTRLAKLAMELTRSVSIGICVLEDNGRRRVFRWVAACGASAHCLKDTTPASEGLSELMARNQLLLLDHAERLFPIIAPAEPGAYEMLLTPFRIEGAPRGIILAIKHTSRSRFDPEDARLLVGLAPFAAAAYRTAEFFAGTTDSKRTQKSLLKSERHAQILLAQLQHGIRNTLAVVRSIARRTADRSETVEQMVSYFEGRLNAFSRVQSVATRNPGAGIDLKALIEDELLAVAVREGQQLKILGPDVCLKPKPAESISLAIHELATNAVKFGALSVRNGRIKVSWRRNGEAEAPRLDLEWVEKGLGEKPNPGREGFGNEMLRRTLPYDLGAETDIEFRDDGMRFTMSMPIGPDVLAE